MRSWVKALADDPQHAFPGQGQMKPEQLEIAQLKREVMAKHIFNLAKRGERDESKLSTSAFQFFTANYKAYAASVGGRTDPRF